MRCEIKRVDPWPVMKVAFFIFTALALIGGLIWSLFFAVISGVMGSMMPEEIASDFGGLSGALLVILVLLFAPIYGVIGMIASAIGVMIYNGMARWAGGITITLERKEEALVSPEVYPSERLDHVE